MLKKNKMCSTQQSMKFTLFINVRMPTGAGSITFFDEYNLKIHLITKKINIYEQLDFMLSKQKSADND